MRALRVRLCVNDVYYGLDIAVEQPDETSDSFTSTGI